MSTIVRGNTSNGESRDKITQIAAFVQDVLVGYDRVWGKDTSVKSRDKCEEVRDGLREEPALVSASDSQVLQMKSIVSRLYCAISGGHIRDSAAFRA